MVIKYGIITCSCVLVYTNSLYLLYSFKGVSYAHLIIPVGRSATAVKVKVKGQGCRFVLSQWSSQVTIFGQWSMVYYISTIDFKEQFMQVYDVQNYTQLTISEIIAIVLLVFRIFLILFPWQLYLSCIKKLLQNVGTYKNSKYWDK